MNFNKTPGNSGADGKTFLERLPNHWKIILVLAAICLGYGLVFLGTARAETLNVACYRDYRPYSYINAQGEVAGVLIDFWQIWARKNEVNLVFMPGHLSQCLERVRSGEADVMIGLFQSGERRDFLEFSVPILDVQTNLYIRQDLGISSLADLRETRVGVIEDDYAVSWLAANHPEIKPVSFPGSEAVIQNALAGTIDAYILDFPNAVFLMAENDTLTRFRIFKTLYTAKLRAGVAKGNTALTAMINQGIKSVSREEIKELAYKWGILPPPFIVRYKGWIVSAIVVLLAGCIGFALYSYRLRSRMGKAAPDDAAPDPARWLDLIREGETESVEFKSSLRWNNRTEKPDQAIEDAIVKGIAAFLNSKGGSLFIGVNDAGELLGLEADYSTFQKARDRDGFILKLTSLVNSQIGRSSHEYITMEIREIKGKDLCCVSVRPADTPVFLKTRGKEHFYMRAGASSASLTMSEAHAYIRSRW